MSDKIKSLGELSGLVAQLKAEGKRVVHCHGPFQLVHPGNIRQLEAAKREGDVLVVTLTPDECASNGERNLSSLPVFSVRVRAETVAALQCVDYVASIDSPAAADAIRLVRPDIFVKSRDDRADPEAPEDALLEEEAVRAAGGRVQWAEDPGLHAGHLLNAYFGVLPPEADAYVRQLSRSYTYTGIVDRLRSLKQLRVLVVGDAIIDEYHFCRPYGMASKSSAIATQFQRAEAYPGGSLAVANHLAGFCDTVHLVTCLGARDSREEFIREHLKPTVTSQFFFRPDASTVIKRRYVESFLLTKLFEVSFFDDHALPDDVDAAFCEHLESVTGDYDLVLVADFGHGLLGPRSIATLAEKARFLAVNAQLNSINSGYNVITKYPRVDYACIDEEETRLAARDRYGPIDSLVQDLAERLQCRLMTSTRGHHGSVTYERGRGFTRAPVLSREVIDTVGAGDSFLAITSACACAGFPPELIGFIGNAVGALAVRIVGNKSSVEPEPLFRFMHSLLK